MKEWETGTTEMHGFWAVTDKEKGRVICLMNMHFPPEEDAKLIASAPRLENENAKLRAFVESTTKDNEKSEFSPWDYHPTWRALEAQKLLKEIDE